MVPRAERVGVIIVFVVAETYVVRVIIGFVVAETFIVASWVNQPMIMLLANENLSILKKIALSNVSSMADDMSY